MKSIEVENDLYRYIASQTESIGEDASSILRRLLGLPAVGEIVVDGPLKDPAQVKAAAKVTASVPEQSEPAKSVEASSISGDFSSLLALSDISDHKAAVGRFLFLLEQSYHVMPSSFDAVLSISGRDRVYFAKDEATLLASNASTKPKQIGQTPYWVITNSNTGKKRSMLTQALVVMGCDKAMAKQIAEQI
ncbi:MAG: replication initiation negative regulator SeqA [Psychrobium sp.]